MLNYKLNGDAPRSLDSETLRRARAGSTDALNDLFDHIGGRLLALIRLRMGYRLRARLESRDVLQASLLKAFERIDQWQGANSQSLMAWLATIAENEIRDQADFYARQCRDKAREIPIENAISSELAGRVRSQTSQLVLNEQAMRLEKALEAIDETYREVILLRNLEELSFKEIGQRLGKSPDACRMLLARALTAVTLKMTETP